MRRAQHARLQQQTLRDELPCTPLAARLSLGPLRDEVKELKAGLRQLQQVLETESGAGAVQEGDREEAGGEEGLQLQSEDTASSQNRQIKVGEGGEPCGQ